MPRRKGFRKADPMTPGFAVRRKIEKTDMDFNTKANIMLGTGSSKKKVQRVIEKDQHRAHSRFD